MSIEPLPKLNRTITQIDTLWQQQAAIDRAVIEYMLFVQRCGQVWGFVVPACAEWVVVDGSLSEVQYAK